MHNPTAPHDHVCLFLPFKPHPRLKMTHLEACKPFLFIFKFLLHHFSALKNIYSIYVKLICILYTNYNSYCKVYVYMYLCIYINSG